MADVLALMQEGLSTLQSGRMPDASFLKALVSKVAGCRNELLLCLQLEMMHACSIVQKSLDMLLAPVAGPRLCDRCRSVTAQGAPDPWHTELRQCGRFKHGLLRAREHWLQHSYCIWVCTGSTFQCIWGGCNHFATKHVFAGDHILLCKGPTLARISDDSVDCLRRVVCLVR